jgi:hypothetical protein
MDLAEVGRGWSASGYGQVRSSCECSIEPWGSIKCSESIECGAQPIKLVSDLLQISGQTDRNVAPSLLFGWGSFEG